MMSTASQLRTRESGLSLIVTLVIAAGASVLIGGVLYYTSTQTTLTRRINQYDGSVAAAVAATEKVVTSITKDFHFGGEPAVRNSLNLYKALVPTDSDLSAALNLLGPITDPLLGPSPGSLTKPQWSKFNFTDSQGAVNQTYVDLVNDWGFRELDAKYPGLRGYAATYRIVSNTREKDRFEIVSAVRQDVQVASVPLSQFQFFYVPDMELHPSTPGMQLNGRIHANANIYVQPSTDVAFQNHITASRRVLHSKHPADPVARSGTRVSYRADRETGLNTLNVPIGTNAGPNELRQILEAPSDGESPTSLLAQERFYNKADLVVVVSNEVVTGRSGAYNGGSVTVPWLETRGIVTRNPEIFWDARECREVEITDIDLTKLGANYNDLTKLLGRPPKTLWVLDLGDDGKGKKKKKKDKDRDDDDDDWEDDDDKDKGKGNDKEKDKDGNPDDKDNGKGNDNDDDRGAAPIIGGIIGSTTVPLGAVRLVNGATLPAAGFTFISPNPVYIQGNYNANSAPALVSGDAVTILSGNWSDANSTRTLSSRTASDTTVNTAIITGIVPTGGGYYSGGVENALRLVEDWSGKTFTFNGSIAVLYYSKIADAPWGGHDEIYRPPARAWSYDANLADGAKTPPSMPAARTVFRSDWTLIKPNSKL
jgi:hypothetical protein